MSVTGTPWRRECVERRCRMERAAVMEDHRLRRTTDRVAGTAAWRPEF